MQGFVTPEHWVHRVLTLLPAELQTELAQDRFQARGLLFILPFLVGNYDCSSAFGTPLVAGVLCW